MHPSAILRENKMLVEEGMVCAYCGGTGDLQWEHIIPKSRGGPDTIDNQVLACQPCNLAKGARDPFQWYGLERRYEVPRLVLGKYLKLVYEHHERVGTLDDGHGNQDGELNVFALGAVFTSMRPEQPTATPDGG